jgi:hypothetical protein
MPFRIRSYFSSPANDPARATFRRWSRWACSIAKEACEQSAEMVDGGLLSVFLVGSCKLAPHAGAVFGVLQVLGGGEIMSPVRALPQNRSG